MFPSKQGIAKIEEVAHLLSLEFNWQEEHSQAGADSSRHEWQSKPQSLKAAVADRHLNSHRVGSGRQHSDL